MDSVAKPAGVYRQDFLWAVLMAFADFSTHAGREISARKDISHRIIDHLCCDAGIFLSSGTAPLAIQTAVSQSWRLDSDCHCQELVFKTSFAYGPYWFDQPFPKSRPAKVCARYLSNNPIAMRAPGPFYSSGCGS